MVTLSLHMASLARELVVYIRTGEMSWKWLNTLFPSKTVKLSLNMDEGDFIQIVWIKFIQSECKVWQITAIIDMKIW